MLRKMLQHCNVKCNILQLRCNWGYWTAHGTAGVSPACGRGRPRSHTAHRNPRNPPGVNKPVLSLSKGADEPRADELGLCRHNLKPFAKGLHREIEHVNLGRMPQVDHPVHILRARM